MHEVSCLVICYSKMWERVGRIAGQSSTEALTGLGDRKKGLHCTPWPALGRRMARCCTVGLGDRRVHWCTPQAEQLGRTSAYCSTAYYRGWRVALVQRVLELVLGAAPPGDPFGRDRSSEI
jgi:hypothetical protein